MVGLINSTEPNRVPGEFPVWTVIEIEIQRRRMGKRRRLLRENTPKYTLYGKQSLKVRVRNR